ncbi:MAG: TatD family hydrolase [Eubacteriales bacterium]|nr:TatD family hydrolase [Eubacteriales bacterium]
MVIDAHMHVFPDALAGKALPRMAEVAKVPYHTDGTLRDTQEKMTQWGIDKGLFLHIATRPGQHKVNDFAASIQNRHILCFGSVHPKDPDALAEMERIQALGLHGVKFHFDYQDVRMDDAAVKPLMDLAAQLGLPVTVHAGWDPYSPDHVHAPVKAIAATAKEFPRLKLIAAHMGGMMRWDEALEVLAGRENVWLDTAMAAVYCPPEKFRALLQKHGCERVLFGSDCPWDTATHELEYLRAAGLTVRQLEGITAGNISALLGLPGQ